MKQTKDTAQFHSWTEMAKTQDLDKASLASQSQCYAKKKKKKKFNKQVAPAGKQGWLYRKKPLNLAVRC